MYIITSYVILVYSSSNERYEKTVLLKYWTVQNHPLKLEACEFFRLNS